MSENPTPDGFPETAEARGIALVSQGLALALLTRLRAKGLLSDRDCEAIFEGCLTSLENAQLDSPDDESIQAARMILDGVAKIALRPA
jgi:hypothetical protein